MPRVKDLPPDTKRRSDGSLYREVTIESPDGSTRTQQRPVAETLEEAKKLRWDYYHPQFGWVIEGYKLAKDRTPQDIMMDGSVGGAPPPEEETNEE